MNGPFPNVDQARRGVTAWPKVLLTRVSPAVDSDVGQLKTITLEPLKEVNHESDYRRT